MLFTVPKKSTDYNIFFKGKHVYRSLGVMLPAKCKVKIATLLQRLWASSCAILFISDPDSQIPTLPNKLMNKIALSLTLVAHSL
jgi:hypothetical protein